jgi:hypothetical protein
MTIHEKIDQIELPASDMETGIHIGGKVTRSKVYLVGKYWQDVIQ